MSNLENNKSILIKYIEMEFDGYLGIESCLSYRACDAEI